MLRLIDRAPHSKQSLDPLSRDVDRNLSKQLSSLNLEAQESLLRQSSFNNHSLKSPCRRSRQRDTTYTPLTRTITIENNFTMQFSSAISGKYDSFGGRPSTDGMINSHEILSQMYCDSPTLNELSIHFESSGSHTSTLKVESIPVVMMRSDQSIICTPSCPNQETLITTTSSFDCVGAETPILKTTITWGSQPIPGKDWGLSLRCEERVVKYLSLCLDEERSFLHVPLMDTALQPCPYKPSLPLNSLGSEFDSCGDYIDKVSKAPFEKNSTQIEPVTRDISYNKLRDRQSSVGSQDFGRLIIKETLGPSPELLMKRKFDSLNKRVRISICASAYHDVQAPFVNTLWKRRFGITDELSLAGYHSGREIISSPQFQSPCGLKYDISPKEILSEEKVLSHIFGFLNEKELLHIVSAVSLSWNKVATASYASLLIDSIEKLWPEDDHFSSEEPVIDETLAPRSVYHRNSLNLASMYRSWYSIVKTFPRGQYLSEGTFKKVYKVWNVCVGAEEALSVIDMTKIDEPRQVGVELAVYVMLSSLTRRNLCPNFLLVRGVFTSSDDPPTNGWNAVDCRDIGHDFCTASDMKSPDKGKFQYIRMELCTHGDIETFIRQQPDSIISSSEARILLFQMAYSLYVAGDHYSLKHNDIKLLNFLLQSANSPQIIKKKKTITILRYALGSHIFDLRMNTARAFIVKLTDFGTANLRMDSNGEPVTIGNFTTLENIPPEFMIVGDAAKQGHVQDSFALGLCMLHLFTGQSPYEEIMETVKCPQVLKTKLTRIWIKSQRGFDVIKSVILGNLCEDDNGNFDGEIDEILFDTLYRYLVLFGIPDDKQQMKDGARVWGAINSCLISQDYPPRPNSRPTRKAATIRTIESENDVVQFKSDSEKFSLQHGNNMHIAHARELLLKTDGAMDLFRSLVVFDPKKRASVLDVINSRFMAVLRSNGETPENEDAVVYSYMAYSAFKVK